MCPGTHGISMLALSRKVVAISTNCCDIGWLDLVSFVIDATDRVQWKACVHHVS